MTFMRLLRMMRIAKMLRLTRVLRVFNDLRIMLESIAGSLLSLFWCFAIEDILGVVVHREPQPHPDLAQEIHGKPKEKKQDEA